MSYLGMTATEVRLQQEHREMMYRQQMMAQQQWCPPSNAYARIFGLDVAEKEQTSKSKHNKKLLLLTKTK